MRLCVVQIASSHSVWRFIDCMFSILYVQQFLTAIEKMDLSNNVITDESTGVEVNYGHAHITRLLQAIDAMAKHSLHIVHVSYCRSIHLSRLKESCE